MHACVFVCLCVYGIAGIDRNQRVVMKELVEHKACPVTAMSLMLDSEQGGSAMSTHRLRKPLQPVSESSEGPYAPSPQSGVPMILAPREDTHSVAANATNPATRFEWVPLLEWVRRARRYSVQLHVGFLQLFATLCESRNYVVLPTLWEVFSFERLMACLKLEELHQCDAGSVRGAYVSSCLFRAVFVAASTVHLTMHRWYSYCDLMLKLYVDCKPQYLVTPVHFTRDWQDLTGTKSDKHAQRRNDMARRNSVAVPAQFVAPSAAAVVKAAAQAGSASTSPSTLPIPGAVPLGSHRVVSGLQLRSSAPLPDFRRDTRLKTFLVQCVRRWCPMMRVVGLSQARCCRYLAQCQHEHRLHSFAWHVRCASWRVEARPLMVRGVVAHGVGSGSAAAHRGFRDVRQGGRRCELAHRAAGTAAAC